MDDSPVGQKLLVIGGGGHAMVVTEAARAQGWRVLGFFDDDSASLIDPQTPRLGGLSQAGPEEGGFGLDGAPSLAIIALGSMELRARLAAELRGEYAVVLHPTAVISPSARIGAGTFVGAGAVIQSRAKIESHSIINTGAIVEHDCVIHENVHVAPRAVLGGAVTVGRDTLIGLGACVRPGIRIGAGCTVGAGAVVVRHVADHATVLGVPAKPAEWWSRSDGG